VVPATQRSSSSPIGLRLHALAYVVLQSAALGAVSFWIVGAWQRWGPKRPYWGVVGGGIASWVVALSTTYDDFAGWMDRHDIQSAMVFPLLALVPAVAVAAALLGVIWSRARLWLRALMLAAALALSLANDWVLPFDYAGMHLFWAWIAAILTAGAVRDNGPRVLPARRARWALAFGCSLAGLLSLLVVPPRAVRTKLLLTPGSVVAPFVTQLWPIHGERVAPLPIQASPWYSGRSNAPARPPGSPLDLPQDKLVLFLTIDSLRADVVADERYRALLPELHRLKTESVYFTLARAPGSATTVSVTALFLGKYYSSTHFEKRGAKVTPGPDKTPRLAALLESAGIDTANVIPFPTKKPQRTHKTTRVYDFGRTLRPQGKDSDRSAHRMMSMLLRELDRQPRGPRFMYVHLTDAHYPYKSKREGGSPFDGYLSALSTVDVELKRLREALQARGLSQRTLLMVSADHGEAFGEHGLTHHAYCVYEEVLRVPLMIKAPGVRPRVVNTPVTLMDALPTVLDLFGQPTPGYVMAESLVPFLRGETPKLTRPIAAESGRRQQVLYFPNGYKVITDLVRKTVEVYDLSTDPGEEHDLAEDGPEIERYIAAQRAFFKEHTLKIPGWKPPWRKF
jgi:arylsulfatase A-like enzyme